MVCPEHADPCERQTNRQAERQIELDRRLFRWMPRQTDGRTDIRGMSMRAIKALKNQLLSLQPNNYKMRPEATLPS